MQLRLGLIFFTISLFIEAFFQTLGASPEQMGALIFFIMQACKWIGMALIGYYVLNLLKLHLFNKEKKNEQSKDDK